MNERGSLLCFLGNVRRRGCGGEGLFFRESGVLSNLNSWFSTSKVRLSERERKKRRKVESTQFGNQKILGSQLVWVFDDDVSTTFLVPFVSRDLSKPSRTGP